MMDLKCWIWLCLFTLTHAIPIDNGIDGEPQIECGPTSIKVTFNTRNVWEGKLYTKNFYNSQECKVMGDANAREASLELGFDSPCGVSRVRSITPRGVFVHATVIMSFHPIFITKVDRAVRLQCFYMEADKTVSTDIEVSPLTTELATHNVPMPVCRYDILDAPVDGKPIKFALVGQAVWHKWNCDTETTDTFCMHVYSCFVDDGTNGDTIQLINEEGCSLDKFLLGNVEYPSDLMGIKEAHVFKYADRPNLYFNCQIRITIKEPNQQCIRPVCAEPRVQRRPEPVPQPGYQPAANPYQQSNDRYQYSARRQQYRRARFQRDVQPQGTLGVLDIEPEFSITVVDVDFETPRQLREKELLARNEREQPTERAWSLCMSQTAVAAYASVAALIFLLGVAFVAAVFFTSSRKRD